MACQVVPPNQGCRWPSQLLLIAGTVSYRNLKCPQPPVPSAYMSLSLAVSLFRTSPTLFPQRSKASEIGLWRTCAMTLAWDIKRRGTYFFGLGAFTPKPWQAKRLRVCWDPYTSVWHRCVSSSHQTPKRANSFPTKPWFGGCLLICTHQFCCNPLSPGPALPIAGPPNHIQLTQLMQTWQ